jgi:hypothetical protein
MPRFQFLELYIQLARVFAGLVAIVGIVQAFDMWSLSFWAFLITLVMGFGWAFLILVGADVLACFKTIEENTRKGG